MINLLLLSTNIILLRIFGRNVIELVITIETKRTLHVEGKRNNVLITIRICKCKKVTKNFFFIKKLEINAHRKI